MLRTNKTLDIGMETSDASGFSQTSTAHLMYDLIADWLHAGSKSSGGHIHQGGSASPPQFEVKLVHLVSAEEAQNKVLTSSAAADGGRASFLVRKRCRSIELRGCSKTQAIRTFRASWLIPLQANRSPPIEASRLG
ncbi:unnamed protein product [Cladocopium goreaui]|nr:unnamed protein product [Cladocopium goreaui]